ncbi:MAG: gamma-glutamylcyclotransferase [Kiloniellales bacterium]|nr:gamma-glutamylcyclotransferase [Kiloniellales bacterium]
MQFFFYGTLMDRDVRRAVFPHLAEELRIRPAVLPGYRRVKANCGNFPVLVRRPGSRVRGHLAQGLDARGVLLMAHFEGTEYLPRPTTVIDRLGARHRAWLFLPSHNRHVSRASWRLEHWRLLDKRRLMPSIERWFSQYGAGTLESQDVPWRVRRWLMEQLGN